jgi:hypothetical protein
MENILQSRAPLHGRARPLRVQPFSFRVAQEFLGAHPAVELIERYAVAGGMPRYLNLLNRSGTFKSLVCNLLLSPNGTLFQEPRTVLEMEFTETAVYFSLIEALAQKKAMEWRDLVDESGVDSGSASKYMSVLHDLESWTELRQRSLRGAGVDGIATGLRINLLASGFDSSFRIRRHSVPISTRTATMRGMWLHTWPSLFRRHSRTSAALGSRARTSIRPIRSSRGGAKRSTQSELQAAAQLRRLTSLAPTNGLQLSLVR